MITPKLETDRLILREIHKGEKDKIKLSKLGRCGILSLLSYMASVFISPIKYPGYDWMSMAVCVAAYHFKSKYDGRCLGIWNFAQSGFRYC